MVSKKIEVIYKDTSDLHDQVAELYEALADKSDEDAVVAIGSITSKLNQIKEKYEV